MQKQAAKQALEWIGMVKGTAAFLRFVWAAIVLASDYLA